MEALMQKINGVLKSAFPDATAELEQAAPADKVGGLLIWAGFEGMEHIKRQNRLWAVLKKGLTRQEQLRITAILTLTPEERTVSQER